MIRILFFCFFAIFISQVVAFTVDSVKQKRIYWSSLIASGGFPSSHSALVSCLTTSFWLYQGMSSSFIISLFFGLIIIRDSCGLRRDVGLIAKKLNQENSHMKKHKLKILNEKTGHTIFEVLGGILFGLIVAMLGFYLF